MSVHELPDSGFNPSVASEQEVADTIVSARKSWKTVKGKSEPVWPPHLEKALVKGEYIHIPSFTYFIFCELKPANLVSPPFVMFPLLFRPLENPSYPGPMKRILIGTTPTYQNTCSSFTIQAKRLTLCTRPGPFP